MPGGCGAGGPGVRGRRPRRLAHPARRRRACMRHQRHPVLLGHVCHGVGDRRTVWTEDRVHFLAGRDGHSQALDLRDQRRAVIGRGQRGRRGLGDAPTTRPRGEALAARLGDRLVQRDERAVLLLELNRQRHTRPARHEQETGRQFVGECLLTDRHPAIEPRRRLLFADLHLAVHANHLDFLFRAEAEDQVRAHLEDLRRLGFEVEEFGQGTVVVRAMPALVAEFPSIILLIAGSGPLEETLKSEAEQLGVNNNVHFLGPRLDLNEIIKCWLKNLENKFPENSKHKGLVKNITPYGVFVELEPGIGGMIHISDLSWLKRFNHPTDYTKVADQIDIIILSIDKENRKLQLGHKQLEEDPWNSLEETFAIGSIHEGTVTRKDDKGALVQLQYGLEGFAPNRHLNKEDGTQVKADETAQFVVIEFDRNEKRIVLSHARIWEQHIAEEKEAAKKEAKAESDNTKKAVKNIQAKVEKATLGDLGALAEIKAKLQEGEGDTK